MLIHSVDSCLTNLSMHISNVLNIRLNPVNEVERSHLKTVARMMLNTYILNAFWLLYDFLSQLFALNSAQNVPKLCDYLNVYNNGRLIYRQVDILVNILHFLK